MTSTFFPLETMRRAIATHRQVMDVIGHNVANTNTPGYSRQVAVLQTTIPTSAPGINQLTGAGQLGTGVMVEEIKRIRDSFVDNQVRIGTSNMGELNVEQDALQRVEAAFMEPSTNQGLADALSKFYDSWQKLSLHPENVANRQDTVANAQNLTTVINQIDQSLRGIRSDMDGNIRKDVTEVNGILTQIGDLNKEIAKVISVGNQPNDLMDSRDKLIDQLSNYLNVNVSETDNGMVNIAVGTRQLVWNDSVFQLTNDPAFDHPSQNTQTPYFADVEQSDFNSLADFASGEFKGLLTARDVFVPEAQKKFTESVTALMNEVNNIHSQGFGQQQFTTDLGLTTTTDIVTQFNNPPSPNADNVVTLNAVRNINVGDMLRIEEPDSIVKPNVAGGRDGITVQVVDIKGNDIYFKTIFPALEKSASAGAPNNIYQVLRGSEVYKIEDPKNNFFTMASSLPNSFIGDTLPVITERMVSTIRLDDRITLNSSLKDIENILGVDITGAVNGLSLNIDGKAKTPTFTEGMTLGNVIQKINEIRPESTKGEPLEMSFDAANHRIILTGAGLGSLEALGGGTGSEMNLLRILGFEGQSMTGFQMTEGTTVDSTSLSSLGVADGWMMVDGVTLQVDKTKSIANSMATWNAALNQNYSTSKGTQFYFDPVERRIKIMSDHQFSVRDATQNFPANPPFTESNFLTMMGFRDADGQIAFSSSQEKASVTSSDIGARIQVNAKLIENVNKVATSRNAAGTPGDNTMALAVGATRATLTTNNIGSGITFDPTQTVEEFYDNMVAKMGTESQRVQVDAQTGQSFLDYYTQQQSKISGVSIDEEMTKMVETQQAFNAASRMINTVDDMLNTIISGMGLVGR